ncbi:MAG: HAMP domain-containing protein, partial [Gammaproteobacteria bacterium]
MRFPRPRTLLGIILLGLAMVTLPLLIAIGREAIQLEELVANSEAVVRESIEVTEQNQRLSSNLKSLERNARSWVRVGEPDYLDLYRRGLTDLQLIGSTLRDLPQDKVTAGRLQILVESALELQTLLETDTASSADTLRRDSQVIGQFDFMNAAALDVDRGMRRLITAELNALEEKARTSQQNLVWQAAALIPATLLLVVFFLFLVGRPMRQLDRAISELGQGRFTQTIDVSGPRDLATLGSQLEWLRQRLLESTEEKNK